MAFLKMSMVHQRGQPELNFYRKGSMEVMTPQVLYARSSNSSQSFPTGSTYRYPIEQNHGSSSFLRHLVSSDSTFTSQVSCSVQHAKVSTWRPADQLSNWLSWLLQLEEVLLARTELGTLSYELSNSRLDGAG